MIEHECFIPAERGGKPVSAEYLNIVLQSLLPVRKEAQILCRCILNLLYRPGYSEQADHQPATFPECSHRRIFFRGHARRFHKPKWRTTSTNNSRKVLDFWKSLITVALHAVQWVLELHLWQRISNTRSSHNRAYRYLQRWEHQYRTSVSAESN